ncbi:MAG TPA: hypothetical protein VFZ59_02530, partial [Verrucomicrobiae bacterium]|nr:hypothetical protein [Verrucomicrobiae bacterium]
MLRSARPFGRKSCAAARGADGAARRPYLPKSLPGIAFVLTTGVALLAGCAVGPNYSRPAVPSQSSWKEGATTTNAAVLPTEWWTIFNDAELNGLEAHAVHANQHLKQAVARVTEARALARVSKSELFPS